MDITELYGTFLLANGISNRNTHYRSKKGSFDYNYAKAEKGDKEMQLAVALLQKVKII